MAQYVKSVDILISCKEAQWIIVGSCKLSLIFLADSDANGQTVNIWSSFRADCIKRSQWNTKSIDILQSSKYGCIFHQKLNGSSLGMPTKQAEWSIEFQLAKKVKDPMFAIRVRSPTTYGLLLNSPCDALDASLNFEGKRTCYFRSYNSTNEYGGERACEFGFHH